MKKNFFILEILEICKLVEKKLGRVKSKKNSPRNYTKV